MGRSHKVLWWFFQQLQRCLDYFVVLKPNFKKVYWYVAYIWSESILFQQYSCDELWNTLSNIITDSNTTLIILLLVLRSIFIQKPLPNSLLEYVNLLPIHVLYILKNIMSQLSNNCEWQVDKISKNIENVKAFWGTNLPCTKSYRCPKVDILWKYALMDKRVS